MADGLSQEVWNIRPGIAPGLKFGGTGNLPDLPWVSTTGRGPNGKTISGVMYRYNRTQVRIVCACHGRHMAPNEFVQHANDADVPNPDNNVVGNSFPNGNQATSAQS
uniref:Tify domain-containing protein n=1 Tax=Araucaria cunninghamii TaxID=56994 RepID=A0A0D6QZK9_ARACU